MIAHPRVATPVSSRSVTEPALESSSGSGMPTDQTWAVRSLSAAPWVAAFAIAVAPWLSGDLAWVRPTTIAVFLVVVVTRVMSAAASTAAGRRTPTVVMGCGLALFACGSLVLALDPGLPFPSPVEIVFGSAYVCFTWFLALDANGGRARDLRTAL